MYSVLVSCVILNVFLRRRIVIVSSYLRFHSLFCNVCFLEASTSRYFAEHSAVKVAQGVSGAVVDKGSIKALIPHVIQGVKHGMQDMGCRSIDELHSRLYRGLTTMDVRSLAAQKEGGVHDLIVL